MNLKIFSDHFSLQFFYVSQCIRKEFGQIYIIIQILNWFDEERPNTVRFKIYYKKPSLCYNCCFANRTIFCNKTSFCNIIYKRILSTLHDVFEKIGVKIIHKHSFWDLWVNIGGIPWDWNFYYKNPLFDVNLKEYGEFENVLPSFFIAIFAHITMFSKRIWSILHKYSNLKLVRWRKTEFCEIESLLQKAVFVLHLLFCKSNHFCNKTSFCNIIYKRILSTLHDVFEKMGVKIMHKHSFWGLWVNIGGIGWKWNFITKSRCITKVVLTKHCTYVLLRKNSKKWWTYMAK